MTVGIRVGSRYVANDMIGRGSFGTVFRGAGPAGPVAIKLLRPDLAADPEIVDRFLRERSILLRLRHPNLVSVHDLVAESGLLALVMDLIEGPDLRAVLANDGPLPAPVARTLVASVVDALAHAHAAGVVHRDVKPENVLLEGGDARSPRLTDFGIALLAAGSTTTGPQTVVGTPGYLAPEVARGSVAGPSADVYAAGVLLYELIAGRPPFQGDHALAVIHQQLTEQPPRPAGLPDELEATLRACLSLDPDARPDAAALAGALRGRTNLGPRGTQLVPVVTLPTTALRSSGHATVTPATDPVPRAAPPARTGHGWPLWLAVLVVVAVLGVAGGYALRAGTAPGPRGTTPTHAAGTAPAPAPTAVRTYLSNMPYTQVSNGWGPVERDHEVGGDQPDDGGPLVLGGTTYQHGLGTNAPAQVRLYPAGACTTFTATVGIDAIAVAAAGGTVSFQVIADGTAVYDSGIITWQTPPKPVTVDVTGAQVLDLVVTDGGDGPGNDHGDWADAALVCRP